MKKQENNKKATNTATFNSSCNLSSKKKSRYPFCFNFSLCKSSDVNNVDLFEPDQGRNSFDRSDTLFARHYSNMLTKNLSFSDKEQSNSNSLTKTLNSKEETNVKSLNKITEEIEQSQRNICNKSLFLLKNNQRVIIAKIKAKNIHLKYNKHSSTIEKSNMTSFKSHYAFHNSQKNILIDQQILKILCTKLKNKCDLILNLTPFDGASLLIVKIIIIKN